MANKAAFGLYVTRGQVESAVDELRANGFRNTDLSVLFPENVGTKDFAHEKGTKAPEGATTVATSGAVSEARSAGWSESERSRFRVSARSSPRGQSWPR
jgi:hypothetical protein